MTAQTTCQRTAMINVRANRHNHRTDLMFCDGHAEGALRKDVVDPNSYPWRARWNSDNDPHTEITWTAIPDPSVLDP